jgi:hypothetical protein
MTLQWERTATFLAHKRAISGVHTQMGQQMMLESEAFLALATLVRTLGGMQQEMGV